MDVSIPPPLPPSLASDAAAATTESHGPEIPPAVPAAMGAPESLVGPEGTPDEGTKMEVRPGYHSCTRYVWFGWWGHYPAPGKLAVKERQLIMLP